MKSQVTKWVFGVAFLGVIAYAGITLSGPHGLRALMEKQRLIQQMEKRNASEAKQIERIREHIKRLDNSPAEQELEIRERNKLIRTDEKLFITGKPGKQ